MSIIRKTALAVFCVASCSTATAQSYQFDENAQAQVTDQPSLGNQTEPNSAPETVSTIPVSVEPKTDPVAARKASSRLAIEEIIVTAQKREENLQDVPISVQAFSGDQLEAKGITEATELNLITPGLSYGQITGFSLIYLRGVGNDFFIPGGDASVATYVDGLYFSLLGGLAQEFGDIKRLEVLKGPQGTLFGRNSTGGAINIVTADPSDHFEANAQVSYGSFNTFNTKAYVTVPLLDSLSASLGVIYNTADNYYNLVDTEKYADGNGLLGTEEKGARLKFLWQPTEKLEAKLTGYVLKADASNGILVAYDTKPAGFTLGVRPAPGPYDAANNDEQLNLIDNKVGVLDLRYDADWATLKSINGVQDVNFFASTDFDGSGANLISFFTDTFSKNFSQEVQILSNESGFGSSLFGRPLTWVLGGYYLKDKTGVNPIFLQAVNQGQLGQSLLDLLSLPLDFPDPEIGLNITGILETKSSAAFGQATWDVLDWLRFTAGGRYQHETRRNLESTLNVDSAITPSIRALSFAEQKISSKNFSPKLVLDIKPDADSLYYLSWSRGFKSGTINTAAIYEPPTVVKPERLTSWEIGAKNALFDGSVRLNTAAFYNDVTDGQVFFISLLSGGAATLENASAYEIYGGEFELTWQPSEHWVFGAGGAYLHGRYNNFTGRGFDPVTGVYRENISFDGNDTVRTPDFTGNASISYFTELPGGQLETTVDYYHSTSFFYSPQNSTKEPAYSVVGARISYLYEAWNLRLTGQVKNLTDTEYAQTRYDSDFATLRTLAPPRTYILKLEWRYE